MTHLMQRGHPWLTGLMDIRKSHHEVPTDDEAGDISQEDFRHATRGGPEQNAKEVPWPFPPGTKLVASQAAAMHVRRPTLDVIELGLAAAEVAKDESNGGRIQTPSNRG